MTNKELSKQIKLLGNLLELHGENSFKVKSYYNASFQVGRFPKPIAEMSSEEIVKLPGVGKNLAPKIEVALETGSIPNIDDYITATPGGVLEMLEIKGIGPSKIRTIWKDLNIDNIPDLKQVCIENKLSEVKGFGGKTQEKILESIQFIQNNAGKVLYAEAEMAAKQILEQIKQVNSGVEASLTGQLLRRDDIIDKFEFLIGTESEEPYTELMNQLDIAIPIQFYYCKSEEFFFHLLKTSGTEEHLSRLVAYDNDKTRTIEEVYQKNGFPYFIPEMRNGHKEFEWAKYYDQDQIIQYKDLTGAVHNHSTWSDGAHSLEEMAQACMDLGYQYFGIADHSKTAIYANGLEVDRVYAQHKEIDELNKKLAPFKIFKGIESDILNDGSLDYEEEILKQFDYIVASVHSQLSMDEEKATTRLIKAIENPHTNILGHLTGRLLLRRNGYPVHYDKIVDACIANNVAIEINANPWRLDMDWRYVYDAMQKGAYFSINPDAHKKEGLLDMRFGVFSARKAGLIKERVINTFGLNKLEVFFKK